jgi:hypothetical protein
MIRCTSIARTPDCDLVCELRTAAASLAHASLAVSFQALGSRAAGVAVRSHQGVSSDGSR